LHNTWYTLRQDVGHISRHNIILIGIIKIGRALELGSVASGDAYRTHV
jgi:hypothetical protein